MRSWVPGLGLVVMLMALGASTAAQERARSDAERAQLEARVLERFLERAGAEAGMSDAQRARVRTILQESVQRHRERVETGARLRRELISAVRAPGTSDAELERILAQIEELRAQEHASWQSDQEAIAGVLSARQRATFSLRWMTFQESVRAMMGARRTRGSPQRPPP